MSTSNFFEQVLYNVRDMCTAVYETIPELFLSAVNLSITACWLILAVLVLRMVMKKAPKWIHCCLWGLVGLRLIFPFSIESMFSLVPSAETFEPEKIHSIGLEVHTGFEALNVNINEYLGEHYIEGVTVPAGLKFDVTSVLAIVWLIGIAGMLGYVRYSYAKLKRDMRTATPLCMEEFAKADSTENASDISNHDRRRRKSSINIRQSENVGSPFVLGIFKPTIYLPYHISAEDMEYVIAHENAHIRRRDHWIKPLGFLVLSVYWFNPLLWVAYVLLCKDIELACDEKVIRALGMERRQDYSLALLNCSINRHRIAACPVAFGEVSVKERVKSVMNYKRPTFWIVLIGIIVCVVAAVCFLTNPRKESIEPFGHSYRVVETTYGDPRFSFSYEPGYNTPYYTFTSDYTMETKGIYSTTKWQPVDGKLEEKKLTAANFDAYFMGLYWSLAENLRKENSKTWYIDVPDDILSKNKFYYLMLQNNGDVYLAVGSGWKEKISYDEIVYNSYIRWVFKLERTERVYAVVETVADYVRKDSLSTKWYEDGKFDYDYDSLPSAQVNQEGIIVLDADIEDDTLIVSEEYYEYTEAGTNIVKSTYDLTADEDDMFRLSVNRRNDVADEYAIYYVETKTGLYVFKVEFPLEWSSVPLVQEVNASVESEKVSVEQDIEQLLAKMCQIDSDVSKVFASSSPADYIERFREEYEKLYNYGEDTLRYCFEQFLEGNQTDLRGQIMAQLCEDLMLQKGEAFLLDYEPANGQEWFDAFKASAENLATQYKGEEMKKYYPVSWMLLQLC